MNNKKALRVATNKMINIPMIVDGINRAVGGAETLAALMALGAGVAAIPLPMVTAVGSGPCCASRKPTNVSS